MRFSFRVLFALALSLALGACDARPPPILVEVRPMASAPGPAPSAAVLPYEAPSAEPGGSRPRAELDDARPLPIVRERQRVVVDGVAEQWRLEWIERPTRACFDADWSTCPCYGFAFGESGKFDLVRDRPGTPEDRLHFEGALQRWPVDDKRDLERWSSSPVDAAEVTRRPEVTLMHLGDYDHDGRATELVLQIGAGSPCMRTWSELVGLDRRNEKLHVFGTRAHPGRRLVLEYRRDWEQILGSRTTELDEVGCGDHGSGTQVSYFVNVTPRGFDVEVRRYACVESKDPERWMRRGKLLERAPLRDEDEGPF